MQDWRKVRIGEFAEVKGGGTPSREVDEYFGGDVPWLSPRDLSGHVGRFVYRGEENLTQSGLDNSSAQLLPLNTVLFSSRATIGRVALAGNPIATSQGFRSLICNAKVASPYYVYYAIQYYTPAIETIASGATYKEISGSALAEVKMHLPPLPVQRKIAAILSAYDDLIANNTRRIAILEEMAQMLYREWFVHFRFPGHEGVEMIDSELGAIPSGWEVVSFTDIADVLTGSTPRTNVEEYWDGPIPFFSPRDIDTRVYVLKTERNITELGLDNCSSDLYPKDTVFITARGTVGRVVMPAVPMAMNQTCYALRGRDGISQYYVFLDIQHQVERLQQRAHGAVFDTIIIDTFRQLDVIKPPQWVIGLFHTRVAPIYEQILNLLTRDVILSQSRDLLLPRLVSGELDVGDLPIDVTLLEA